MALRKGETVKDFKHIPNELKNYPNWLVHKNKVPYSPITNKVGNKGKRCGTYEQALQALESGNYDGLGFQFSGTPFAGIDLDHHVMNGHLDEFAAEIFLQLNSYTEYSYSGTGLHIIVRGEVARGLKNSEKGIEVYSEGRYFTMTGDKVKSSLSTIKERQSELDALCEMFGTASAADNKPKTSSKRKTSTDADDATEPPYSIGTINYDGEYTRDELEIIVHKIRNSKKGRKFDRLFTDGDTSEHLNDNSRADFALMMIIAFWVANDAQLMHDVFSLSALAKRGKWQQGNRGNREYYRALTIREVIRKRISNNEPNYTGRW